MLYPLSLVLTKVLDEAGDVAALCEARIVDIFFLFSQAESHVKEMVADRMILKSKLYSYKMDQEFDLTIACSCSQGPQANEPTASNHDAKIHQEFIDALHDPRCAI